jgi:hypothetical protein
VFAVGLFVKIMFGNAVYVVQNSALMRRSMFAVFVVELYVISMYINVHRVVERFALTMLRYAQIVVEGFVNHV